MKNKKIKGKPINFNNPQVKSGYITGSELTDIYKELRKDGTVNKAFSTIAKRLHPSTGFPEDYVPYWNAIDKQFFKEDWYDISVISFIR